MAYFAHITNGIVDSVSCMSQETLDSAGGWYCPECGSFKPKSEWVETSKMVSEGVYEDDKNIRKNSAGKGDTYDVVRDAFIPKKEYDSFIFNEEKCVYEAPKPLPKDGKPYEWDESQQKWKEVIKPS